MNQTVICDQCGEGVATELWDDTVALCDSCYEGRPPKTNINTGDLKGVLLSLADSVYRLKGEVAELRMTQNVDRKAATLSIRALKDRIECLDIALSTSDFLGGLDE